MNNYIQLEFTNMSSEESDILIAQLSAIGFEGFEEEENSLKAFIPATEFDEDLLNKIIAAKNILFKKTVIEERNWNAFWESNFEPVVVDDFVAIRADFHEPIMKAEHEIIITPKMSFGTGHHATTYMMVQQMREIDFAEKTVFDFGTGTGVLAILAEKRDAKSIFAVDNDDWCIVNATENIHKNSCIKIKLEKANRLKGEGQFDIILANINRNIILENFEQFSSKLARNGNLLLSGLLEEDEEAILDCANKYSLKCAKKLSRNGWISLRLNR